MVTVGTLQVISHSVVMRLPPDPIDYPLPPFPRDTTVEVRTVVVVDVLSVQVS